MFSWRLKENIHSFLLETGVLSVVLGKFGILVYDKYPKKFRTLYSILFWPKFCFLYSELFLKVLSGMANSVDPDQTAFSV